MVSRGDNNLKFWTLKAFHLEFTKEIHGTIGMKNCIINPTDHDDVYIIRSYDSYSNTPSIVYGYIGIDYEEV